VLLAVERLNAIAGHLLNLLALLLLTTVLSTISSNVRAQAPQSVSVIAFPGTGNWPIRLAQDKGYFAQTGVAVTLTPTPSSVFQITKFAQGDFDIAMTAVDNVIAYMEGQGEVLLSQPAEFVVFMGGGASIPSLTTVPEVTDYRELKGKTLAVDAITTGYAFVLFDLLRRHGVTRADYNVESLGGTTARWEAMRERKVAATILTSPFDLMAARDGFHVLEYAKDVYGHYEQSVATARRSWTASNGSKLVAFVKGYVAAVEWLRNLSNRDEAITTVGKYFPQLPSNLAPMLYDNFVGPRGVTPKAQIDIAGVRKVLELRNEYGNPKSPLTDPSRYYDPQYYDAAVH
jgi:ABC-type nitrate/sulfonate/bicarbonate transport system substrate-binding protein